MKRSEFVAKLHSEEDPWVTSVVELAEAAGCKWDPEEEPLPERLRFIPVSFGGEFDWGLDDGEDDDDSLCVAVILRRWGQAELAYRKRVLTEAVRRYNLFPRIEAAYKKWQTEDSGKDSDDSFALDLEAILYAKETP